MKHLFIILFALALAAPCAAADWGRHNSTWHGRNPAEGPNRYGYRHYHPYYGHWHYCPPRRDRHFYVPYDYGFPSRYDGRSGRWVTDW